MEKQKRKLSKSALILIIGILIILIPCLIFAGILLSSAMESNKPVIGKRFENDLQTKITNSDASDVEKAIETIAGVEKVEVDGIETGQLVVLIDAIDSYTSEEINNIANEAYDKVVSILPVQTYFTASESNKNYDLAIHIYNRNSANDDYDSWSYTILTKNSKMELPTTQIVSQAKDENLAKELRGELESADLQIDETAGTSEETGE